MKTLTTDQIKQIDQLLITRYQLVYIDVRMEILDHIATDIENLLDTTNYEDAKKVILYKWDKQLLNKTLYKKGVPTSLLKKWRTQKVFRLLKSILLGSIIMILTLPILNSLELKSNVLNIVLGCFYALILFSFAIWQLINKKAFETTPIHTAKANYLKINIKKVNLFTGVMFIHLFITVYDQSKSQMFLIVFGFALIIYAIDIILIQKDFIK